MENKHSQIRRRIEEFPDIQTLNKLVQRRIEEAKLQLCGEPKQATTMVSNSPLSEVILECEFQKKKSWLWPLTTTPESIQHIRHFRDKVVFYSCSDPLLWLTFPFSLKDVTSDWFYSLLLHSLHNFKEVTEAFLTQYDSRQKTKKNNHHFLTVKMR